MTYSPRGAPRDFDAVHDELRRIASEFRNQLQLQTITPEWTGTLGNGTLTGYLATPFPNWQIFTVSLTWGSTTSHGASSQQFQLPEAIRKPSVGAWQGSVRALESGVNRQNGIARIEDGWQAVQISEDGGSADWSNTVPFTWGTNDTLQFTIAYAIDIGRS